MAETCRQALEDCGVKSDRLALEWASAAEGPLFVEKITKYINQIKSMGSIGKSDGESLNEDCKRHIEAACFSSSNPKVRTAFGNLAKKMHQSNDYSIYTKDRIKEEVKDKVFPVFRLERITQEMLFLLKSFEKTTFDDLCSKTGATLEEMEKIISSLSKKGTVLQDGQMLLMGKAG